MLNLRVFTMLNLCPEQDSNLHILGTLVPETSASTNSAIRATQKSKKNNTKIAEIQPVMVPRTRLELAHPKDTTPSK